MLLRCRNGDTENGAPVFIGVYCDLSAGSGANSLERDLDHAKVFVTEFQDRIMLGRDYFDRRQLDVLEKLDLPDTVMEKVLHLNAETLLAEAGKTR